MACFDDGVVPMSFLWFVGSILCRSRRIDRMNERRMHLICLGLYTNKRLYCCIMSVTGSVYSSSVARFFFQFSKNILGGISTARIVYGSVEIVVSRWGNGYHQGSCRNSHLVSWRRCFCGPLGGGAGSVQAQVPRHPSGSGIPVAA